METCPFTPLCCLILLTSQYPGGFSDTCTTGHRMVTPKDDCQCQRSKEMFDIVQTIVKGSNIKEFMVITDSKAGCGDLTNLSEVLFISSCSSNRSTNPPSAKRTTLSTVIIDCDQGVSQDIISRFILARRSGGVERRLVLPVHNFIITRTLDLDALSGLDLTANHFVSIIRSTRSKAGRMSTCRSSYKVRKAKGKGPWETVGKYYNGYHGNLSVLRNTFVNFEGMHLKVTHSEYIPFTIPRNGTYYGFCLDLLDTMSKRLNFTYEVVYSIDRKFGVIDSNGTWNGMIGMMVRQEVDMIFAGTTISSLREEFVDFTIPFFEEKSTVLVRANFTISDDSWTFLFAPLQVWLLLAGSVFVCGGMLQLLDSSAAYFKQPPNKGSQVEEPLSFLESVWLMFCAYVKQGAVKIPSSESSQFMMATFWLVMILVGGLYAANLTTSLATVERQPPFNNLQELVDSDYNIIMNGGSIQRLLLENAPSGIYAALWRKISKTRDISLHPSTAKAMERMFTENKGVKYAALSSRTSLENKLYLYYSSQCDWVFMPETFFTSGLGLALPEGSPYKQLFDEVIINILESGLPARWKKKYFAKSSCNQPKAGTQSEAKAINFSQVKLPLAFIGGGMVISAIAFFIEMISAEPERVTSL